MLCGNYPGRAIYNQVVTASVLLCLCLLLAGAQSTPPTNTGIEDLIAAGKLAAASKPLQVAVQPDATLQQKRLATIDDKMDQALSTLRAWLNRPDRVEQPGALADLPPEALSQVRLLARALMVEQYVFLASGRVGAAIDSARDGLRMSYAIKPNSLIQWLTGNAVDGVVTQTIVRHLDQLSQKDCESLLALARDWQAAPDPTRAMIEAERKQAIEGLKAQMEKGLAAYVGQIPGPDSPPELKNLSKTDWEAFWKQVIARLDHLYTAFLADLNEPSWERLQAQAQPLEVKKDAPPADRMAASLFEIARPALEQMLEARGKQQARARMVGCHAAIRNYRWEHDSLPATLDALRLGDMATDPFTGVAFQYKPGADQRSYTLQSAGPPARDDKGNIKQGERILFTLTK
jgi:phage FluMu protein gp41